jgi:hypothetical protein
LNVLLVFSVSFRTVKLHLSPENVKRIRFPIVVKRGSSTVKIYRDRKPEGTYYRVTYYLGGKRCRLNFSDLQEATNEAEAKASQLSRGDMDAMQLNGNDRLAYGRALDAVKEFNLPLDTVAASTARPGNCLMACPCRMQRDFTRDITDVASREKR